MTTTPLTPPTLPQFVPARISRAGSTLIIENGAEFPDRCLKCNQPAEGFRKKTLLRWHQPWIYVLVIVALLIYAIVAIILTQKLETKLPLCPACRTKRRNRNLIGVGVLLLGLVSIIAGAALEQGAVAALGAIAFLAGLIFWVVSLPIVRPRRIEDGKIAWVSGAGAAFLDSLPDSPLR